MKIKSLWKGKNRYIAAAVVAAALGGGAYAFAATLTVSPATLGSGSGTVTNGCNLAATYSTTYNGTTSPPEYDVSAVNVSPGTGTSPSTACDGLNYRVTVGGPNGASLEEWTGTLSATGTATLTPTVTIPAASVDSLTAVVESPGTP